MPTDAIRYTIALAKQHEQQNGYMSELFNSYVAENSHLAIQLPQHDAARHLLDFIIAYIDHVPDFIDSAWQVSQQANIEEYSEPFLKLAEDFFLKPPEIISRLYGLLELMDEAYLAHRLMEEVNDRFMAKTAMPLIPQDMTRANLVVHSLIGEPFANELDEAVLYTAERIMIKEHVYNKPDFKAFVKKQHSQHPDSSAHWPCFMDTTAINLPLTLC